MGLRQSWVDRGIPFGLPDSDRAPIHRDAPNELDCLRGVLPVALLHAARRRSQLLNLGADQILIQWGMIDETAYIQHLARHLGTRFDDLSQVGRSDCPLAADQIPQVAQSGILPLQTNGTFTWTIAPRGFAARYLTHFAANYPSLIPRVRLTTHRHLHQFLTEQTGDILADIAAERLRRERPDLSAMRPAATPGRMQSRYVMAAICLLLAVLYPTWTIDLIGALAAVWFLAFSLLRLACVLVPEQRGLRLPSLPDDQLPVYSVVVALYREAASVPGLLRSLQRLDYPRRSSTSSSSLNRTICRPAPRLRDRGRIFRS